MGCLIFLLGDMEGGDEKLGLGGEGSLPLGPGESLQMNILVNLKFSERRM
jgi:hypothetical protein